MKSYRDLIVWQKSYALALAMYQATREFPKNETFGLVSQLRRAAVSVPSNIAEGYCRRSRPDYLRFLSIAQGSVGEVDTLLCLCRDLGFLEASTAQLLANSVDEVGKMLTGLTQSLQAENSGTRASKPLDPRP